MGAASESAPAPAPPQGRAVGGPGENVSRPGQGVSGPGLAVPPAGG